MAVFEGILFADTFISSKDQFINFFVQHYTQNQKIIDTCINTLNQVLIQYTTKAVTPDMAAAFKVAWNNFEKQVLLNQTDLQIIVAYRGEGGKNGQFSQILKQEDIEGKGIGIGASYGINAGHDLVKDSIQALNASKIEEFLQFHLNGLLNQLESSISHDEAVTLHKYHTEQLNAFYQTKGKHLTGLRWRVPFYGGGNGEMKAINNYYYGGRGLGKVYDAFMNHMANKETQIFNYLRSGGKSEANNISLITHRTTTVYTEENEIGPSGHFPQLLKDSTNHTGWYTGGDIIIVNPETMSIVYNIQLKTTTANKPSVFGERIEQIRAFLKGFQELTPEQKAEKIFNFMLTSISNHDVINKMPQEDIEALVEKEVMNKLNIK